MGEMITRMPTDEEFEEMWEASRRAHEKRVEEFERTHTKEEIEAIENDPMFKRWNDGSDFETFVFLEEGDSE